MQPDYGLDYTVELFDDSGKGTGLSFNAQLKATDEPDLAKALGGVRFRRDTADYYLSLPLPVLIVRYHAPTGQLYVRWFHAYNPHLATREDGLSEAKSLRFQFYLGDLFDDETHEVIELGLRGYLKFHSPELALPLRVAVTSASDDSTDAYKTAFALRSVLGQISDLVTVEVRERPPTTRRSRWKRIRQLCRLRT